MQDCDGEIRAKGELMAQKGTRIQSEGAEARARTLQQIADIKEKIDMLMQFKIESVG